MMMGRKWNGTTSDGMMDDDDGNYQAGGKLELVCAALRVEWSEVKWAGRNNEPRRQPITPPIMQVSLVNASFAKGCSGRGPTCGRRADKYGVMMGGNRSMPGRYRTRPCPALPCRTPAHRAKVCIPIFRYSSQDDLNPTPQSCLYDIGAFPEKELAVD